MFRRLNAKSIIIHHFINITSIRNKIICAKTDVFLILESKLVGTFPMKQFCIYEHDQSGGCLMRI